MFKAKLKYNYKIKENHQCLQTMRFIDRGVTSTRSLDLHFYLKKEVLQFITYFLWTFRIALHTRLSQKYWYRTPWTRYQTTISKTTEPLTSVINNEKILKTLSSCYLTQNFLSKFNRQMTKLKKLT